MMDLSLTTCLKHSKTWLCKYCWPYQSLSLITDHVKFLKMNILLCRYKIKSLRGEGAVLNWKLEGRNDGQSFEVIADRNINFAKPELNNFSIENLGHILWFLSSDTFNIFSDHKVIRVYGINFFRKFSILSTHDYIWKYGQIVHQRNEILP